MNRICMQCGERNPADGLLCPVCHGIARVAPQTSVTRLAQNNAARQNIIEQMAKRINELESTIAAQHDLLEERGEALERAQADLQGIDEFLNSLGIIKTYSTGFVPSILLQRVQILDCKRRREREWTRLVAHERDARDKRISELEAQLAATLAVIERSVFVEHDDRPSEYSDGESATR